MLALKINVDQAMLDLHASMGLTLKHMNECKVKDEALGLFQDAYERLFTLYSKIDFAIKLSKENKYEEDWASSPIDPLPPIIETIIETIIEKPKETPEIKEIEEEKDYEPDLEDHLAVVTRSGKAYVGVKVLGKISFEGVKEVKGVKFLHFDNTLYINTHHDKKYIFGEDYNQYSYDKFKKVLGKNNTYKTWDYASYTWEIDLNFNNFTLDMVPLNDKFDYLINYSEVKELKFLMFATNNSLYLFRGEFYAANDNYLYYILDDHMVKAIAYNKIQVWKEKK